MSVNDFTEMVCCFMRVAWAAAAGKLHLASSSQPIKEGTSIYSVTGSRSRQSSTGINNYRFSQYGEIISFHLLYDNVKKRLLICVPSG